MESHDKQSRTRLTREHSDACPVLTIWQAYCTRPRTPREQGTAREEKEGEVYRLVEALALGSVGKSTQKNYSAKWSTWVKERKAQGKAPRLHTFDDPDEALTGLLEFMAFRCFVQNNQQPTVRGYFAPIIFFHKMFAGWELPTSHCMIVAAGKRADRAHTRQKGKH